MQWRGLDEETSWIASDQLLQTSRAKLDAAPPYGQYISNVSESKKVQLRGPALSTNGEPIPPKERLTALALDPQVSLMCVQAHLTPETSRFYSDQELRFASLLPYVLMRDLHSKVFRFTYRCLNPGFSV